MAELELPFERLDDDAAARVLRLPRRPGTPRTDRRRSGSRTRGPAPSRQARRRPRGAGRGARRVALHAARAWSRSAAAAAGGGASVSLAGGGTVRGRRRRRGDRRLHLRAGHTARARAPRPPAGARHRAAAGRCARGARLVGARSRSSRRAASSTTSASPPTTGSSSAGPRLAITGGAGRPPGRRRVSCARCAASSPPSFRADAGIDRLPVTHAWSGVIGYTLDALPVLGRDRDRPAVVHALGWCGHGVALSVASGAWIARLVFESARARWALVPRPLAAAAGRGAALAVVPDGGRGDGGPGSSGMSAARASRRPAGRAFVAPIVLGLSALSAFPAGWRMARLYQHLRPELDELLPPDSPAVRGAQALRARAAGSQYLGVVIRGPAAGPPAAFAAELGARVRRVRGARPDLISAVKTDVAAERAFLAKRGCALPAARGPAHDRGPSASAGQLGEGARQPAVRLARRR